MNKAYLSFGSNRGDRAGNLNKAVNLLGEWAGNISAFSSIYETPPWRMTDNVDFLNQVILVETDLLPGQLMGIIFRIESIMGRIRTSHKYEPRTIDIDILFYNDEVIKEEALVIPHPLIQERRFVLEPMAELAPDFIHPVLRKNIARLLVDCEDKSVIQKSVSK
jgi:2-amino-4-hydroxy-6-hydroxymethyldihydropteridine diphosphokinase